VNSSSHCRERIQSSSIAAVPAFQEKVAGLPGLQDVTSDLQVTTPELAVDLDREQTPHLA
jgi:HAE1 family hydrophobic/amphiphilic exporter-1